MSYPSYMGNSDRDPLFFPPSKHREEEDADLAPPEVDVESQEKRLRVLVLVGVVVVVVALFTIQSGPLREGWNHLLGRTPSQRLSDAELAKLVHGPPQRQAMTLLSAALDGDQRAASYAEANAQSWRGSVMLDQPLNTLVHKALDSRDLKLRSAGMEVFLAGYGISENLAGVDRVLSIAQGDPTHRAWALYTLGMLGYHNLKLGSVRETLLAYAHDPEE